MGLEDRIQRLEDIKAIAQLKARYCEYCDDDYRADKLEALFLEDAVWDGGVANARFEGRPAIRAFFEGCPARLPFAIHNVMNPRIEVDGDRATGVWYLIQPCTSNADRAVWIAAVYNDRYRKVDGRWFFEHVNVKARFVTPHDEGWAKTRFTRF